MDRFELFVDLPGVAASDVEITLESGVLTLSGEWPVTRREELASRHRRERGRGRFYRRFILPDTVDPDRERRQSATACLRSPSTSRRPHSRDGSRSKRRNAGRDGGYRKVSKMRLYLRTNSRPLGSAPIPLSSTSL